MEPCNPVNGIVGADAIDDIGLGELAIKHPIGAEEIVLVTLLNNEG
jgi:hypothetical protein